MGSRLSASLNRSVGVANTIAMSESATILLVEDDASILNGMADLLQIFDIGYNVTVVKASDGLEGLAKMESDTPDLIISDIMMPRLNGFEFLNEVRGNPAWIHIPFIFLTAKGKKQDIMAGRRSGAELYITKPFVSSELLELVKSQLDRTFQLQAARQQRLGTLKRNLLQLLNHEFRTPLTYVTAYYDMLADSIITVDDPSSLQEYLRGIQVGCVRLTNLIEDLIKIMELRTGQAAATFRKRAQPIRDLAELFRQRGQLIEGAAEQAGLRIDYDIQSDLPTVIGDTASLADAIDRLLDNAVKFTHAQRDGPRSIRLSCDAVDGWARLTVEDSGVGFPAHIQEQLFDLFFQHNRERLEQQGSGSGLTIAKGLVDLHQGRIDVSSKEGIGSTFSLLLPPATQQNDPLPDRHRKRRPQATILIVEDDLHLLEGLSELLEMADSPYHLRVVTAINGRDGLTMLEKHQPDLIISDVMMPVMGGYEFLQQVRSNANWLQIPFIFLTAKGEHEDVHRGRRSGAEEYITKPYDIDDLLDLTVTQLDRYFQRQGAMNQSFEALKRSILAMLQPDFKSPLDMVTSYSEKLAEDLQKAQTDEDLVSSLHVIQRSSERLTRLVEDFISMAEFRTGEAEAAFRMRAIPEKNVGLILYEAVYALQMESELPGVQFSFDLDENIPPVLCDRERLLDTFRRLVSLFIGADDELHAASRIHVATSREDNFVSLSMSVQGSSFPASWRDELSGFLSRVDNDVDEDILELDAVGTTWTVVKSVVLLHDGLIDFDEIGDDHYEVNILLPAYEIQGATVQS